MKEAQFHVLFLSFLEPHDLWSKSQQPVQGIGQELPSKQEADARALPIVLALLASSTSQPLQELNGHLPPAEPGRVRPTPRPVDPSQAPVRVPPPKHDAHERG